MASSDPAAESPAILEVRDLRVDFAAGAGWLRAVGGVSFRLEAGRTLALVGESGCGKSASALAIMGLLPPGARMIGDIRLLDGHAVRGRDVAMVFQDSTTGLNPAFTIGEQVAEVLRQHAGLGRAAAMAGAVEMLARVRIPDPARRAAQYPHQLSGGMRQRVMIAQALICRPRLLIADEPTTALDVTVQAQILALLDELKRETGTAVLLISHDLGLVADHADDVLVMYAGRIAEQAPVATLFARPEHPYTVGLLGASPGVAAGSGRLASIAGAVPDPRALPAGCPFAPRCPFRVADCAAPPPIFDLGAGHGSACWRAPLDQVLAA